MDTTAPAKDLPEKQQWRRLRAVVVQSPDERVLGRSFRVGDRKLSIGRDDTAGVTIRDTVISRTHCVLSWGREAEAPIITDNGSSNGTFVNGSRQQSIALEKGDVVRVGDSLLVFEGDAGGETPDSVEGPLKGRSAAIEAVRDSIRTAAPTQLTVMIQGETGTGKELVAGEVHRLSGRTGELVSVNCAAIAPTLAESTFFGHVRGAFTGAAADRDGLFTRANSGTLFLDEVGELPLELQAKLLRVLEDRKVTPVGSSRTRRVDVRVVTATNVSLEEAVEAGTFRADLLGRLEDWPIHTPPLRERPVDVPLLFAELLESGRQVTADAMEALLLHDWPRNVRELGRLAKRLSVAVPAGQAIDLTDLPEAVADELRGRRMSAQPDAAPPGPVTREAVVDALRQCDGNVSKAARVLCCGRKTLYRRLSDFDIDPESFRT